VFHGIDLVHIMEHQHMHKDKKNTCCSLLSSSSGRRDTKIPNCRERNRMGPWYRFSVYHGAWVYAQRFYRPTYFISHSVKWPCQHSFIWSYKEIIMRVPWNANAETKKLKPQWCHNNNIYLFPRHSSYILQIQTISWPRKPRGHVTGLLFPSSFTKTPQI
jgi:hypothetical protein